jgi:hypothetical protein
VADDVQRTARVFGVLYLITLVCGDLGLVDERPHR